MSFREKFNWAVVLVTALLLVAYGSWYAVRFFGGDPVEGAGPILLGYLVWFVVLAAGGVFIASRDPQGAEDDADERDRIINMKAALPTMHIYGFALTALIVAMFLFDLDKWHAFHAIVAIQLVATIFEAGAKIRFYGMAI